MGLTLPWAYRKSIVKGRVKLGRRSEVAERPQRKDSVRKQGKTRGEIRPSGLRGIVHSEPSVVSL